MKTFHFLRTDLNGKVIGQGTLTAPEWKGVPVPPSERWEVIAAPLEDINDVYFRNGRLVALPEKPSAFHDFNPDTWSWEPNIERASVAVRSKRNDLLAATDWVVLRANDQSSPVPAEWSAYRQALRDVTQQTDPFNVVWPEPPK